ncbi:MAG: hypothetical protein U0670_22625 [Anaerolineae bacterium]
MPSYTAFGLTFQSEIAIPEFEHLDDRLPDVIIRSGAVPNALTAPTTQTTHLYQINRTELLYRVPGVARYYVHDGREMVIESEPGIDEASVRAFLLTTVLAGLMHQRRMFPLRASAVQTPRGAVLFAGDSVSGKSTLAGIFLVKGYRLLHDNLAPIEVGADGKLYTTPGYPALKLWEASASYLDIKTQNLQSVRPGMPCYMYPVADQFAREKQEINTIYVIGNGSEKTDAVFDIRDATGFQMLLASLYCPRFPQQMGILPEYWAQLTKVTSILCKRLVWLKAFDDRVHKIIRGIEGEWL